MTISGSALHTPTRDCALCPRLSDYRNGLRKTIPDGHNAPVPAFGPLTAPFLVVGLAPGARGANRTGRPFTGDFAGALLYGSLIEAGLIRGEFGASPDDGMEPLFVRITNAVRCVPPANKPLPIEQKTCRPFLVEEMKSMTNLRGIFALGRLAHEAVLRTKGLRLASYPFAHGIVHRLPDGTLLGDTYHSSRYNQNVGRLTPDMFKTALKALLNASAWERETGGSN